MEPLKTQFFNATYFRALAEAVNEAYPIDTTLLTYKLNEGLDQKELMERLEHTATTLQETLPQSYPEALHVLIALNDSVKKGFSGMVFPNFIQRFGLDHFKESMNGLSHFTQHSSSEFGIRPFFKKDFDRTLDQMIQWSMHDNHHIRRLASEGSRPRLPWSFQLEKIKNDPNLTLPILRNLKEDPELYVKKSVGNHLNDHSKDHPDWVLDTAESWGQTNKHTAWIIKRGIRTLIKNGHPRSFSLMGFEKNPQFELSNFHLSSSKIKIGDSVEFSFNLTGTSSKLQRLVIDYAIIFTKKNSLSRKVFKLKEIILGTHAIHIKKRHSFADLSTRKHHKGAHTIEIQINGIIIHKESIALN